MEVEGVVREAITPRRAPEKELVDFRRWQVEEVALLVFPLHGHPRISTLGLASVLPPDGRPGRRAHALVQRLARVGPEEVLVLAIGHVGLPQVYKVAGPVHPELSQRPVRHRAGAALDAQAEDLLLQRELRDAAVGPGVRRHGPARDVPQAPGVALLPQEGLGGQGLGAGPPLRRERGAEAAHGHVGALARGEVDPLDVPRGPVEVDAVLGQELELAVGAEEGHGLHREDELHRGVDEAQAVPDALLHLQLRLPHAVHQHEDLVFVDVGEGRVPP
mmetsp:Transcript_17798/g.56375  ORF Transcript_17798/g.56375 Transcript_17798/m.56375 type:complete len:275 (+) Transcript_17798:361-1185(+)